MWLIKFTCNEEKTFSAWLSSWTSPSSTLIPIWVSDYDHITKNYKKLNIEWLNNKFSVMLFSSLQNNDLDIEVLSNIEWIKKNYAKTWSKGVGACQHLAIDVQHSLREGLGSYLHHEH